MILSLLPFLFAYQQWVMAQTFCVSKAVCLYSEERNNSVAFRIHTYTPSQVGWFGFGFGSDMDSAEVFVSV
jgi:hypothetical protein